MVDRAEAWKKRKSPLVGTTRLNPSPACADLDTKILVAYELLGFRAISQIITGFV